MAEERDLGCGTALFFALAVCLACYWLGSIRDSIDKVAAELVKIERKLSKEGSD